MCTCSSSRWVSRRVAGAAFVALASFASGARGQARELYRVPPPDSSGGFGSSLAVVDDLDGDGIRDLVVGAPYFLPNGRVYVLSGRDGTLLRTHDGQSTGSANSEEFGATIVALDDLNGDGIREYAVFAPYEGRVEVRSGGDGAFVQEIRPHRGGWTSLDHGPINAGDLDGDGHADLLLSDPAGGGTQRGRIQAWSTSTWSVLWEIYGENSYDTFGNCMQNVGDVDGDGVDDVLVQAHGGSPSWSTPKVYLISQAHQTQLWRDEFDPNDNYVCDTLGIAGDADGDGVVDVLVTHTEKNGVFGPQFARLTSGADGHGLGDLVTSDPTLSTGYNYGPPVDVDGDGQPECLTGGSSGAQDLLFAWNPRTLKLVASTPVFPNAVDSIGDVDGDGFEDVVVGNIVDGVVVLTFRSSPSLTTVTPARGRYDADTPITLSGSGFALAQGLTVDLGGTPASDVAIVDDATLTCTVPSGTTGPIDVTVTDDAGSATLAGAFARTPDVELTGDFATGGSFTVAYKCDPGDTLLAIVGLPPEVSIPVAPFDFDLKIAPFFVFFVAPNFGADEIDVTLNIPNDPALSGAQLLFQALVGPKLGGKGKAGAWTNAALLQIR